MKVKHVNAKPGEHVVVHRQHGGGGGSGEEIGCFLLIALGGIIWLIISFWKIILGLVILSVLGWLIWLFRRPIGGGFAWLYKKLKAGIQSCFSQKKVPSASGTYSKGGPNYGKIRQHKR